MKTYLKTFARMFGKHLTRFLSIIFMVLVSVGFISGIGSAADRISYSLSDYYVSANVSDFILKDKSGEGFGTEKAQKVKDVLGLSCDYALGSSFDVDVDLSAIEDKNAETSAAANKNTETSATSKKNTYSAIAEKDAETSAATIGNNAEPMADSDSENGAESGEKQHTYVRFYFLDFSNLKVNLPEVIEGTAPNEAGENSVLCERADNKLKALAVGDKFNLDFRELLKLIDDGGEINSFLSFMTEPAANPEVEVCGIVQSPLTFGMDGEPSYFTDENAEIPDTTDGVNSLDTLLSYIFYVPISLLPTYSECVAPQLRPFIGSRVDPDATLLPADLDMYVTFSDRTLFNDFSSGYTTAVKTASDKLTAEFGDGLGIIKLDSNYSFRALHAYGEKVTLIGYVLMIAFLFVTVLVTLSTMTRLLEEERGQIACLSTLGYSPAKTISKYLLFAVAATGIGGVGAYFIGLGVSQLIYIVFGYSFAMPPMSDKIAVVFFLIIFAIIVAATVLATFIAGRKLTGECPAELLRPKPPKSGKKTFLEKIPFIWNRLSFKYKSTVRNVLRYKSRFFMTVVSVAISTALVLAGLALLDLCLFHGVNSPSLLAVALVVVVFAGLLTAVVIYTLTNINVSERNRELATLMVLGYYDGEVAGYIYREIYIDAVIGIILGFPLSLLIMFVLFDIMATGSFATVSWFVWLIAPVVVLLFTAAVTLILRHKIVGVDMNESLKATE